MSCTENQNKFFFVAVTYFVMMMNLHTRAFSTMKIRFQYSLMNKIGIIEQILKTKGFQMGGKDFTCLNSRGFQDWASKLDTRV